MHFYPRHQPPAVAIQPKSNVFITEKRIAHGNNIMKDNMKHMHETPFGSKKLPPCDLRNGNETMRPSQFLEEKK